MKYWFFIFALIAISCSKTDTKTAENFTTKFEKSKGTETATYLETIAFYKKLAAAYPQITIQEIGETDSGYPLHLILFNTDKNFNINQLKNSTKNIIFINNGIHPGESDGIDASMLLLRNLVQSPEKIKKLKSIILAIIPVYNVGGALNRNSYSRVNQNGPKEYGFRGNARNYDLNRDFIKADTKNAQSFAKIFTSLNPDVFIDTHVSNGADYQYSITHLFTQHNKLGNDLGTFIEYKMKPAIVNSLHLKNILITPYVNVCGKTPENGFSQFFDSPRYSTGYTTLFNTLGLMVETHMLKPYKIRVEQTYSLLNSVIKFTIKNGTKIKELRKKAVQNILKNKTYPINYQLDKSNFTVFQFKGFEGKIIPSKVTTGKRLFYDETKPYTKPIPYYNQFKPTKYINIPKAYILKNGWWRVLNRLKENHINYTVFEKDTTINVVVQHIKSFKTNPKVFEGHYMHYQTETTQTNQKVKFFKNDIYIPVNQSGARYLFETLEGSATDSFFNWNYFDTILQQKEGYSPYVFEDIAEQCLKENPTLKKALKSKIKSDTAFANNPKAQLDFVYKNSPYYEPAHLKLPIYKVY
ncbi:M14 family metallopeptidase [Lutibacter sp.]|uniref:M14 family metallopeptidase n=1 Tax=Lutibacter sp. TaxID=1925666 RepID=UPI0025BDE964|nr:M14 family metallopeptidase [Lutibacter sp.]MCF6182445.1 M14 family metallopeptidase [Lutibacter sp.]